MRGVVISPPSPTATAAEARPGLLLGSPRDDAGNLIMLGTGQQHWSTVHVADLADFFRRVLEDDYPVGSTSSAMERIRPSPKSPRRPPSRPARRRGTRFRRRGSGRLGDYFAEVLLLDQGSDAAKARAELDWRPSHPGLVDEFRNGSYRNGGGNR